MRGAQGFARDLPDADGVVADHDALAATAKNDVVALSALLPDGVGQIAVNVHVVVFHGADAEEVVERKRIELGDVENVCSELSGLFARERAGGRVAPRENAIIRLRLEDQELGQRGEKLEGAERFQLLLRGDAVRDIEHVALLLEIVKVLLRPRIQIVMLDQVAAFELGKARDSGEQVVVTDDEDLVDWPLGGIEGG